MIQNNNLEVKKETLPNFLFLVSSHNKILYQDPKLHKNKLNIRSLGAISRSTCIVVCNKGNITKVNSDVEKTNLLDILDLFVILFPNVACSPSVSSICEFLINENSTLKDTANINTILYNLKNTKNLDDRLSLELDCLVCVYKILLDRILSMCREDKDFLSLLSFVILDDWNWKNILSAYINFINNPQNKIAQIWDFIVDRDESQDIDLYKNINTSIKNVSHEKVIDKLRLITKDLGSPREEQITYATKVIDQFNKSAEDQNNITDVNNILLAEAGTGVGKTLAYCAAVLAFIDENLMQQVLISTYSKVLQKQIYDSLQKSFENEKIFKKHVVLVKGTNNYVCLLNYQYLLSNPNVIGKSRLFLAIVVRLFKINNSEDLNLGNISSLAYLIFENKFFNYILNKREECIYSKCKFFKKCFIMNNRHNIKKSNIIISNHSLTLLSDAFNVKHVIFDEAHSLFNTADEIYSSEISIKACLGIRSFLYGISSSRKSETSLNGIKQRLTTLLKRIEGTYTEDNLHIHEELDLEITDYLDEFLDATESISNYTSLSSILNHNPAGVFDDFFHKLYLHILGNTSDLINKYTQEVLVDNYLPSDTFLESIDNLKVTLERIINLASYLIIAIDKKISLLSEDEEKSFILFKSSFEKVCVSKFISFLSMLYEIKDKEDGFIYRFLCVRYAEKEVDIVYSKNYINPMVPFVSCFISKLNSLILTSATLSSQKLPHNEKQEYLSKKFGLNFLHNPNITLISLKSPFDYKNNSKIIICNMPKDTQVSANVLHQIFMASNGGALCLFTSIERLKHVYSITSNLMIESYINIYAQHHNDQNVINILDLFKYDINSCMFGTDAARDGIDIPGSSLRVVVFDKMPWPKSDILLKIRKKKDNLGNSFYEDIVLQNLKQAFGRLIRTSTDKGIFIILDKQVPSSLLNHFDSDIEIHKLDCNLAIKFINDFFN